MVSPFGSGLLHPAMLKGNSFTTVQIDKHDWWHWYIVGVGDWYLGVMHSCQLSIRVVDCDHLLGAVSPVTTLFTPFHKWIGLMFHNFYKLNFLSTYFLVASKNINFNIFHVKFSNCKSFALNKPKFFTLTLPFIVHTFLYT